MTTPPPPPGDQPPPYGAQPPGYGAPPPGYGAPPPGYAPPAGYGPAKTNTLAIVSLVTAFLCTPAGLITGIISLGQIKKTGEGGRGLALAGVIISAISIVIGIIFIIAVASAASHCTTTNGVTTC